MSEPEIVTRAEQPYVAIKGQVGMAGIAAFAVRTPEVFAWADALIRPDHFRYSFAEVAGIGGRTPAACRQLASSARRRLSASSRAPPPPTTPGPGPSACWTGCTSPRCSPGRSAAATAT